MGKGTHNQNILQGKNLFLIKKSKGKKENSFNALVTFTYYTAVTMYLVSFLS